MVRGVICAALGGICWGFSGTCAQLLTGPGFEIPVAWITCTRLCAAMVLFLTVCAFKNWRSLRAALRDFKSLAAIAGFALLGVLLTQISYLSSISYTNAGIGTVLERLGLIVILGYVCISVRRFPTMRESLGLIFAMAGVFLIATHGNIGSLVIPIEGLAWGVVSAFSLAFYSLLPVKPLAKWGSFIVTGLAMSIAALVSTAVVQPWNIDVDVTPTVVVVLALMVLIGTFGAYLLYLQGVNDAGSVRASLIGCLEPVSAMVISSIWLGTAITAFDIVGGVLILIMVALTTQRDSQETPDRFSGTLHDTPLFQGKASLLGFYRAHKATANDFNDYLACINVMHESMAALGVDEQGGSKAYPSERRVMRAIDHGEAYVVTLDAQSLKEHSNAHPDIVDALAGPAGAERIIGIFAVGTPGDAAYAKRCGAYWQDEHAAPHEYASLHWICVTPDARACGVGAFIVGEAWRIALEHECHSLRADVYPDNMPIRSLLEREGFRDCGAMEIRNSLGHTRRRRAYEKTI